MPTIRQKLEQQENNILAPYALKNSESLGRETAETVDEYRLDFARDRDRIIHTKAFRRLKGKTQVFVSHFSDHYRSRLTHSLEVAQIARTLARIFSANEDVAEAVALAHDLGHTPFGHAGQSILSQKLTPHGQSFEHNAQSRRILETLEPKNLSKEILQCLCKHPTRTETKDYNLAPQNFIEGQIVDIADFIAYTCHDLQDGFSSGFILAEDFDFVPENLIDVMVQDVANFGLSQIEKYNFSSPEDIRNHSKLVIDFSPEFTPLKNKIRDQLFKKLYHHEIVKQQTDTGEKIISDIFDFLLLNPEKIPHHETSTFSHVLQIKDFIAGMTDNFAERFYDEVVKEKQ